MSARTVTERTCDLCGYGGPFSRPEDFVQHGSHDFCRWCTPDWSTGTVSCGGHEVVVPGDGSWQCSCGKTYGAVVLQLRLHGVSLAAMDSLPGPLDAATASLHVNTPNWPAVAA